MPEEEKLIEQIYEIDRRLENILLEEPEFVQRDGTNIDLSEPKKTLGFELFGGLISIADGITFEINGTPIFQWEQGQNIGAATTESIKNAINLAKEELESKIRYEVINMSQQAANQIMDNITSGANEKSPVTDKGVKAEKLEFETDNERYANKETNKTIDGTEVKSYESDVTSDQLKKAQDIKFKSDNIAKSKPKRLLETNFKNDLQTKITSKELAEELGLSEQSEFPFYFESINHNIQRCYFTAYLDNISENTTANWNKENFYGRTEGIAKYTGTDTTLSLTFMIVPDWPSGINYMYKKLTWLKEMNYATYKRNSNNEKTILQKPPILRLTIGNLYIDKPGHVTSLDYDFDLDADWDMKSGKKIPKKVDVNVSYDILHEEMPDRETEFYSGIDYADINYYNT